MSTELAPRFVIQPATGEQLSLDAPDDQLALALDSIRTLEGQLRDVKSAIGAELIARLDLAAKWSRDIPGVGKISAPSSAPDESWPAAELREGLLAFVDVGSLTIEAVDAAVEQEIAYKLHKTGVNALRKRGGPIAELIAALRVESPPRRYVSFTRS
jgi:hypothetical protein